MKELRTCLCCKWEKHAVINHSHKQLALPFKNHKINWWRTHLKFQHSEALGRRIMSLRPAWARELKPNLKNKTTESLRWFSRQRYLLSQHGTQSLIPRTYVKLSSDHMRAHTFPPPIHTKDLKVKNIISCRKQFCFNPRERQSPSIDEWTCHYIHTMDYSVTEKLKEK